MIGLVCVCVLRVLLQRKGSVVCARARVCVCVCVWPPGVQTLAVSVCSSCSWVSPQPSLSLPPPPAAAAGLRAINALQRLLAKRPQRFLSKLGSGQGLSHPRRRRFSAAAAPPPSPPPLQRGRRSSAAAAARPPLLLLRRRLDFFEARLLCCARLDAIIAKRAPRLPSAPDHGPALLVAIVVTLFQVHPVRRGQGLLPRGAQRLVAPPQCRRSSRVAWRCSFQHEVQDVNRALEPALLLPPLLFFLQRGCLWRATRSKATEGKEEEASASASRGRRRAPPHP
jgi:hypothetical protein